MLTLFNRKKLITTLDARKLCRVRNALADAGIFSTVRTPGTLAAGVNRSRGMFRASQGYVIQYTIYVFKTDYARAWATIQPRSAATKGKRGIL